MREESTLHQLFSTLLGRSKHSRMAHGHYRIYRVVPSVGPVCSKRFHRHYTRYRQYRDHALNIECSTFAIGSISVLNEIVETLFHVVGTVQALSHGSRALQNIQGGALSRASMFQAISPALYRVPAV